MFTFYPYLWNTKRCILTEFPLIYQHLCDITLLTLFSTIELVQTYKNSPNYVQCSHFTHIYGSQSVLFHPDCISIDLSTFLSHNLKFCFQQLETYKPLKTTLNTRKTLIVSFTSLSLVIHVKKFVFLIFHNITPNLTLSVLKSKLKINIQSESN
jgi:hypothetical protein